MSLLSRAAPQKLADFLEDHWAPQAQEDGDYASAAWRSYPEAKKIALLRLVALGTHRPERDLKALKSMLNGELDDQRVVSYAVAQAAADIFARYNQTAGLARALEPFAESGVLGEYNKTGRWRILLALVYTMQRAGPADALPALEAIMSHDPSSVKAEHEEAYFETPLAWAATVVRNGLFEEYSRPQSGERGEPELSKLQEMLKSEKPMFAAAAVYAIMLYQQQQAAPSRAGGGPEQAPPPADLPDL